MGPRGAAAGLLAAALVLGGTAAAAPPAVAVLLDDMGNDPAADRAALALPGPLAYAFLPHAPHTRRLAELAHRLGKEVLLHLPMEAVERRPLGGGALTLDMDREALARTLRQDLAAVPHAIGVNNHMGSLLTRHPGHMTWLMEELARLGGLFFVDSRTTAATVAERMAAEQGLPHLRRDVFLDHDPRPEAVRAQFRRLVALARRRGTALAIGHPHPATLAVLREMLPDLEPLGVRLLPLSRLVQRREERRPETWQVHWSP